ncbi:MAG: metalloregulator ArsR/SmtB family transcription factor [Desulfobulbus sp.]|jgi:ArsR family transcriptional regulator|nr:metalloregulator ArsR/SmtB family transcription factor [Desulfobulbus sp.]
MKKQRPTGKDWALVEAKAAVLKALGHPTRLWMAEQLADGEKCVCELGEFIEADFSTISKHLAVLKQAGVVVDEKRGKQVYYRLKVPCILKYMSCVEAVIKESVREKVEMLA